MFAFLSPILILAMGAFFSPTMLPWFESLYISSYTNTFNGLIYYEYLVYVLIFLGFVFSLRVTSLFVRIYRRVIFGNKVEPTLIFLSTLFTITVLKFSFEDQWQPAVDVIKFVIIDISSPFALGVFSRVFLDSLTERFKETVSAKTPLASQPSFTDVPISDLKEDKFGRKNFIELCVEIVSGIWTNSPKIFHDAVVVGLYGEWGDGKTSTVNLMKPHLEAKGNVVIVNFNPWLYSHKEHLTDDFFAQMKKSVLLRFWLPTFGIEIQRYVSILDASESSISKLFTAIINLFVTENTVESQKEKLESILVKHDIKVVAIIDDVDRLHKDDLLKVFKLVKLTADFKNLVFILPMDSGVMPAILGEEFTDDDKYMEKMVQVPISVPKPPLNIIEDTLLEDLELLANKFGFIEEYQANKGDIELTIKSRMNGLFLNMRHVKRYVYALHTRIPMIKREVAIHDLIILEAIRVICPKVIDDMWQNHRFYIPFSGPLLLMRPSRDYEKKHLAEEAKIHFEGLLNKNRHKRIILNLIKQLFPEVNDLLNGNFNISYGRGVHAKEKKIADPEVFIKYHIAGVSGDSFSSAEVEDIIDSWNTDSKNISDSLTTLVDTDRLSPFLRSLLVFNDRLKKGAAAAAAKHLIANIHYFTHDTGLDLFNILSASVDIANREDFSNEEMSELMKTLIKSSSDWYVKFRLTEATKENSNYYWISQKCEYESFSKDLANFYKDSILKKKLDVFEQSYWGNILEWLLENVTEEEKEAIIKQLIIGLDAPEKIGKLVRAYAVQWDSRDWNYRFGELEEIFNAHEIMKLVLKHEKNISELDTLKAISLFKSIYNSKY